MYWWRVIAAWESGLSTPHPFFSFVVSYRTVTHDAIWDAIARQVAPNITQSNAPFKYYPQRFARKKYIIIAKTTSKVQPLFATILKTLSSVTSVLKFVSQLVVASANETFLKRYEIIKLQMFLSFSSVKQLVSESEESSLQVKCKMSCMNNCWHKGGFRINAVNHLL